MSQLEFGQERNLRACIDPAKRIRATRHRGQLEEISLEVALSFLNLICFGKDFLQEVDITLSQGSDMNEPLLKTTIVATL